MSGDAAEFELDLNGNTATVAKKMAAELVRLESQLLKVNAATLKTERSFARSRAFGASQWRDIVSHSNALERSKRSFRSLAPASAAASRALRTFGISGGWIRRFSIDTAKAEVSLRRLYRVKGGGTKGAASVAGALGRRGVAKYGGSVASGAGSMAMGAASMAGTGALAVGGAAAAGAGLLGYSMASTAIQAEKVRFALDRITDGRGQEWWATSSEYAKKFGLNINDVAQNLMGMKANGFGDDLAKTMFQQFADMRSQGATSDNINNALLGLKQLRAAGRATAEDLNQVTENLSLSKGLVWEQLAQNLGKNTHDVKRMQEAGNINSDQMIQAISQAIAIQTKSPNAGDAGSAATTKTVSGAWDQLSASFSVASANALGSDALAPLRESITGFTAWINGPGGAAAIGGFGGVMSRLFEKAPAMIEGVIWFLDTALPAAWQSFSAAFSSSGGTNALESLSGTAESLSGDNGEKFLVFMQRGADAAGNLAGAVVSIANALSTLSPLLEATSTVAFAPLKAAGWVSSLFNSDSSMAANTNGYAVGNALGQGMSAGMFGAVPMVQYAAQQMTQSAEDAARAQSETHSPSRAWERFGGDEGAGYSKGLLKSIPTIQSSASAMSGSAMGAANQNGGSSGAGLPPISVQISIERGQSDGKTDREVMEIAADVFERRMTQLFGRLAYAGAR